MNKIKVTHEDCVHFTLGMLHILEQKGFYVHSAQEAFVCLSQIVDAQVVSEIDRVMEEAQCPSCQATSHVGLN